MNSYIYRPCPQCKKKNKINAQENKNNSFHCIKCNAEIEIKNRELVHTTNEKINRAVNSITLILTAVVIVMLYKYDQPKFLANAIRKITSSANLPNILPVRNGEDRFLKYVKAVDVEDVQINERASKLTRNCHSADHYCEVKKIVKFIAKEIKYRNDPTTHFDYIKSPIQTLESEAGDCEDKTILSMSLMGTLGIRTLMVFEEKHTYSLACFDHYIDKNDIAEEDIFHFNNKKCYAIESTSKKPEIGVKKDRSKIIAIYDQKTKNKLQ